MSWKQERPRIVDRHTFYVGFPWFAVLSNTALMMRRGLTQFGASHLLETWTYVGYCMVAIHLALAAAKLGYNSCFKLRR